jgi:uncharacterized protein
MQPQRDEWNSCLYECVVRHRRHAPRPYQLSHGYFLFCLDLDELPRLSERRTLFGYNRTAIYRFNDIDHLIYPTSLSTSNPQPTLKDSIIRWVKDQGICLPHSVRILLVTLPRFLGYVFNPVSFYYISSTSDVPLGAVAEVGNTFGELKPYWIPPNVTRPGHFNAQVPKHFYVSPFSPLDATFHFDLKFPRQTLRTSICTWADGNPTMTATLAGKRRPLTDNELIRLTLRYPMVTGRIITMIHWHALKLWLRGLPWYPKADRPEDQRNVFRPHATLGSSNTETVPAIPAVESTPFKPTHTPIR